MGREQSRHLCQHRQQGGGRRCPRLHGWPEFAQEQHGRRLAGLVGCFPVPGARGIGSAEGRFHRRAENAGIDALPALEMGKKPRGRAGDGGGRIGKDGERKGRGRWSGHGQVRSCHGENLDESGNGDESAKRSLWPRRFKPLRLLSSSRSVPRASPQPNRRPSPVIVYSLARIASSVTASEV